MAHRVAVAHDVAVLAGATAFGQTLVQERPDGVGRALVLEDEVELRAIAGREQHAAARARGHHAGEGGGHLVRPVREAFAHLEGRRAVVDSQDLDPHRVEAAHKNRSAPGSASLSAR